MTHKQYVHTNATVEPIGMELHTRDPQPFPVETKQEFILIDEMLKLASASIEFGES